ncbi:uncharacterized protein LOC119587385 [Penaeus monodon]|uniref:uncharacterized protein LOC119587385 n=1 Tax=Penaeus monodon TaxID=6687 RepID=UPI0018A77E82|nr:uncharacterized protein LOC119587385 [Penaeus monodon]
MEKKTVANGFHDPTVTDSQWGEGRVALVTGGARRVGRAIVFALHRRGFNVVVHCNNSRTEAQAVADELNSARANSAHVISGDLSWGRLDLLVNNAPFFPTPIVKLPGNGDAAHEHQRHVSLLPRAGEKLKSSEQRFHMLSLVLRGGAGSASSHVTHLKFQPRKIEITYPHNASPVTLV